MSLIVVVDRSLKMIAASSPLVPIGKPSTYAQELLSPEDVDQLLRGGVREFDRTTFLSPFTDVLWHFEGVRISRACEGHLILYDEGCQGTEDAMLTNSNATDFLGIHRTTLWRHAKSSEVVRACRRPTGWSKNALACAAEKKLLPF